MEPAGLLGTGDHHERDERARAIEARALQLYAAGGTWLDALAQARAERRTGRARIAPGKVARTASLAPRAAPPSAALAMHEGTRGGAATAHAPGGAASAPAAGPAAPSAADPAAPVLRPSKTAIDVTEDVTLRLTPPPPPSIVPGAAPPPAAGPAARPAAPTIYRFEVRRHGASTWLRIGEGSTSTLTWSARAPGKLALRGTTTVDGRSRSSQPVDLVVRFPDVAAIGADAGIAAAMHASWRRTLDFAHTSRIYVQERGFWIFVDTLGSRRFATGVEIVGTPVSVASHHELQLGHRPADEVASPDGAGRYVVATFHTHTPTTYATQGLAYGGTSRDAGPSPGDRNATHGYRVPGFNYDYVGAGGQVPVHHPLDAPARVYPIVPPSRRPEPA